MKRYFNMTLTFFIFSLLNALTYLMLGIILHDTSFSQTFSITYPLQFVLSILLSFFVSASSIRANKEENENCVQSGMILGTIFAFLVFGIVAIFVDDYVKFMNMDSGHFRIFTLMSIAQLFFTFVVSTITETMYFKNEDKKANICNSCFIILNFISVTISALITSNQIVILLINILCLLIYTAIWFCLTIKKFKFDFNVLKNFKFESLYILGDTFMLLIYLLGYSKAFSYGGEYVTALNFVNLITDPQWDALGGINKIAKIEISQNCYNYKKALKHSAIVTLFYTLTSAVLFFSLFKVYNVVLWIGGVYLAIQIGDMLLNSIKANIQTFLQLEFSATVSTIIYITCKIVRTVLSISIMNAFNTNIAQIVCGFMGLILFEIFRFKYFKCDKEGILKRKQKLKMEHDAI